MSKLLKSSLLTAMKGAMKLIVTKSANILSTYNLCSSIPNKNLVASLSSLGTLSTLRLDVQPTAIASTYSLSTAVT